MQKIKFKKYIRFFLTLIFLFGGFLSFANASTLNISPEGGSYSVGDIIVLKILVTSPSESINAVSSKLRFTQDNLSMTSVSKSGSIISIWAQEPTFSNAAGSVSFEGITLGGYTGNGATVVTMTMRATKEGTAMVNFVSGAVLANDGQGTNTLKGQNEAVFNIGPAKIKEIAPTETPKQDFKEKIKEAIEPAVQDVKKIDTTNKVQYIIIGINPIYTYMIIAWVVLLFLILYLYFHYKYKVKRKIEEAKKIAKESFKIIKEDEKENSIKTLDHDIDDAQKVIIDTMNEIEKM